MSGDLITAALIEVVRGGYRLRWDGLHGWGHWMRVRENGLRLAAETGADPAVVEMFSLFHDARRWNDDHDPDHGARGAALAGGLSRRLLPLDAGQRELLVDACTRHTLGLTEAGATVRTCWDADRLDLGRAGIRPDPWLLCTPAARRPEVIHWAWWRSRRRG